jgi:mRNA interferase MazF
VVVAHGEIWWVERPPGGRPALVLTRDQAIPVLHAVVVAWVTRSIRDVPSQLPLGSSEGLPTECVANFDDIGVVRKSLMVRKLGSLGARAGELCATLEAMAGC